MGFRVTITFVLSWWERGRVKENSWISSFFLNKWWGNYTHHWFSQSTVSSWPWSHIAPWGAGKWNPWLGGGVWIDIPLPEEKRSTDLGRQGQSDAIRNQQTTLAGEGGSYRCLKLQPSEMSREGKRKKDVTLRNCVSIWRKRQHQQILACLSSLATTHYLSFASRLTAGVVSKILEKKLHL